MEEGPNFCGLLRITQLIIRRYILRDYIRGGAEGALASPEIGGSERRTEGQTDNALLKAPSESKS